jgi:hypothetical protein
MASSIEARVPLDMVRFSNAEWDSEGGEGNNADGGEEELLEADADDKLAL